MKPSFVRRRCPQRSAAPRSERDLNYSCWQAQSEGIYFSMMPFYKVPAVTSNDGGPRRVRAPLRHSVNNGGSAANTSRDRDVMGVQRTSSADKSKLQSLSHSDKVKSVSHEDALYHDPLQTLIFCIVSRADKRYLDTGCLECYRPHASVNTTTPKIDRKHMHCRQMPEIRTRYIPWK